MVGFLKVQGTKLVDEAGSEVILRGAGLGGWLCMENFISGFPGCEFQIRETLAQTIGASKAQFFFDKYIEHFFTDDDAAFFKSLGLNCIRIALNYRHFEDPLEPRTLRPGCFDALDRVVAACAAHGIYTILDLHTAPGGQSGGWHADAGTHIPLFWAHRDLQDSAVWLWTQLAGHYRDNTWVAGYNPLNEPADPTPGAARLLAFYDAVASAIRAVDTRHPLFLDGNTFASDFTAFPDDAAARWPNAAFAIHDYSVYGFPAAPEPYARTDEQRRRMARSYAKKREWADARGLCVWNGEWGPVYARREYDGEGWEETNKRRYAVLQDQLELYDKDRLSWSIWLYKDIGFQGMVHVGADTPYMRLLRDSGFLQKKYRLAVDAWGADDAAVRHIFAPLKQLIREAVPDEAHQKLYPYPLWTLDSRVDRIARTILVGEFLVREWAEHFIGKSEDELDELARSFRFENCLQREGLNKVLTEYAARADI